MAWSDRCGASRMIRAGRIRIPASAGSALVIVVGFILLQRFLQIMLQLLR